MYTLVIVVTFILGDSVDLDMLTMGKFDSREECEEAGDNYLRNHVRIYPKSNRVRKERACKPNHEA